MSWFPNPLKGYDSVNCLFSGKIKCKKPFYPFASFDTFNLKEENEILILEGKGMGPENFHSIAVGKYFTKYKKIIKMPKKQMIKHQYMQEDLSQEKILEDIIGI